MSLTGKIGQRLFLLRHRGRPAWFLLLAVCLCAVLGVLLVPRLPWFSSGGLVYCHLPNAIGLQPGQIVLAAPGGRSDDKLGVLTELRPEADGMLVIITLDRGVALKNGSVLQCKSDPDDHRTSASISSPLAGHDLVCPVVIPGEIVPGAPDGYLEPLPRWPAAQR